MRVAFEEEPRDWRNRATAAMADARSVRAPQLLWADGFSAAIIGL